MGDSLRTSIVLDFVKKTANQVAENSPKDSQLQKTIPLGFPKSCFCIFRIRKRQLALPQANSLEPGICEKKNYLYA